MKTVKFLLVLPFFALLMASCHKDCNKPTGACAETPPTDEMCAAYFERWFYNDQTGTCQQIGYSGCSAKGFATEGECLSCQGR